MDRFRTTLDPGTRCPYRSSTFVVVPERVAKTWVPGPHAVSVSISGQTLRGTASRGEGVMRVPLPQEFRERAAVSCGDTVTVLLDVDRLPRDPDIPNELRVVFEKSPELHGIFDALPPSMRRAWANYIGEAKHQDTRSRRAARAHDGIRARLYPR